jgi:hypothetical protein
MELTKAPEGETKNWRYRTSKMAGMNWYEYN